MEKGRYEYHFQYVLPSNLPSSYKEYHGYIRYLLKANVEIPYAFDYKDKKTFHVMSSINFNKMLDQIILVCSWLLFSGIIKNVVDNNRKLNLRVQLYWKKLFNDDSIVINLKSASVGKNWENRGREILNSNEVTWTNLIHLLSTKQIYKSFPKHISLRVAAECGGVKFGDRFPNKGHCWHIKFADNISVWFM